MKANRQARWIGLSFLLLAFSMRVCGAFNPTQIYSNFIVGAILFFL